MTLAALAALMAMATPGCIDGTGDGPRITGVAPDPARPGDPLVVTGFGFGVDGAGHVAVGGRPVDEFQRSPERVEVRLPRDLAGGETWLVVVTDGRPSPAFPLRVDGPDRPDTPPRAFPPGVVPDGGRIDRGVRDGGPPAGDGGPPPRDRGAGGLVALFDPDPAGAATVRLDAVDSPPGRLVLDVRVPAGVGVRGLALHLDYDRGLLRFAGAEPAIGRDFAIAEIGPGRLALGRMLAGGEAPVRVTFDLVGPGEGRIDVPPRHRTARGGENQPLPAVDFAGGGLRVVRP